VVGDCGDFVDSLGVVKYNECMKEKDPYVRDKGLKKQFLMMVGFAQALGLTAYATGVGVLIYQGGKVFGQQGPVGVVLFLLLFVTSALISALIGLAYPSVLIWKHRQVVDGLKLIAYTAMWLVIFILILILLLMI